MSAEGEVQNITSLPSSLSVTHWLRETNYKLRGMVGCKVFFASRYKIFPSSSYRICNYVVEPAPQVLGVDHYLMASIKAAEVKAIESLARSSLVLSYIEHFDLTPPSSSSSSWRR